MLLRSVPVSWRMASPPSSFRFAEARRLPSRPRTLESPLLLPSPSLSMRRFRMVDWESGFQRGRPWARKLSFVSFSSSPAMSRMAGSRSRAERARCSRATSTSSERTVISMMGSVIVDSFGQRAYFKKND